MFRKKFFLGFLTLPLLASFIYFSQLTNSLDASNDAVDGSEKKEELTFENPTIDAFIKRFKNASSEEIDGFFSDSDDSADVLALPGGGFLTDSLGTGASISGYDEEKQKFISYSTKDNPKSATISELKHALEIVRSE